MNVNLNLKSNSNGSVCVCVGPTYIHYSVGHSGVGGTMFCFDLVVQRRVEYK